MVKSRRVGRHWTKPQKKKRGKNNKARLFLVLLILFIIILFFANRLTKMSDYNVVAFLNTQDIKKAEVPAVKTPKVSVRSLLSSEQVRTFAADFGIREELVRFSNRDSFTEVHLPVNFNTTDLNFTNFELTKFLKRLGWEQRTGIESNNRNLQVLSFTAPQDKVNYQFRIYYAPAAAYPVAKNKIAIVVKGFGGFRGNEIDRWLTLHENICFSVLPIDRNSRSNMRQFLSAQREALIEIPMEDPGFPAIYTPDYAIFANKSDSEVKSRLRRYFRNVPNPKGAITTQGGLITTDTRIMRIILKFIKNKKIYFIDDTAIETSIAFVMAQQEMMLSFERTVTFNPVQYLDDTNNARLQRDLRGINRNRILVTLHRPDNATYEFVQKLIQVAESNGFEITRVSELF